MCRCCNCCCMDRRIARICRQVCPGGTVGPQGPAGENGSDGLSAYEIWIEAGNVGTEQDFIDSLIGEKGEKGEKGDKGDPGITEFIGAQFQSVANKDQPHPALDPIPIDNMPFNNSNGDIDRDNQTESFIVTGPAIYKIDWTVSYSEATDGAAFMLIYNGIPVWTQGYNPNIAGSVSGSAIVNATEPTAELQLITLQDITLPNGPLQANITFQRWAN